MDYHTPPPDDAELPAILSGLIDRTLHTDLLIRREAVEQVYELALKVQAKACVAIPALIRCLGDPDPKIGESALWALHYCAPDSVEPLVDCLGHPLAFVRERAAHSLGNVGDSARELAASELRTLLRDSDQEVRKRAAWALGLMHDTCENTVVLLAGMTTKGSSADASAALHALGNIGRSAGADFLAPYRDQVLDALRSPDGETRRCALYAGESIGLDLQAWADTLVGVVGKDESIEVRSAALSTIKELASLVDLGHALPILVACLSATEIEAALSCGVLGAMQPRPKDAIPFLEQALARDELVLSAASALWRIQGCADVIIPAMRRVFDENGEGVCDLICELGPSASPLIPEVINAMSNESWDLQWAAADALKAVASSDEAVLGSLLEALSHPSPIVRSASAKALASAGSAAVEPLRCLLIGTADSRATWAAYALGRVGPPALAALPDLRAGMRSGSPSFAGCCAIAVVQIAGETDAVPYLVDALQSNDIDAPRQAAAMTLAELGPAASTAVPVLERFLEDEDFDVAEACAQALMAIRGKPH
jgi:HEAT repeat protein